MNRGWRNKSRKKADIPNSSRAKVAVRPEDSEGNIIQFPTLRNINVGQPDANVEYYNSLRTKQTPIYLDSFFILPHFPIDQFLTGEKFLIYGQKGTGKTAGLRYIESQLKSEFRTDFIIFKRAFLEESDLAEFSTIPLAVDEEEIKSFKHYHHAVKRILIMIILKMAISRDDFSNLDFEEEDNRPLIEKILDSGVGDVIKLGFDSVKSIVESTRVNLGAVTDQKVLLESGRALKRSNDDLLRFAVRCLKRNSRKIAVFVDEIHFAYRNEEALQQDAMLVRDSLLAIHSLSDRFVEEQLDVRIYAAVRAEYLEHPIISSADINHTVESIGFQLSWSSFPFNMYHPLIQLTYQRFKASIGTGFMFRDFLNVYLKNLDIHEFIQRTWVKPRDFIRFFKCAKDLFPDKSSLTRSQLNSVWRTYAQEAWNEIKSSASPFMSGPSIASMEAVFREVLPQLLAGGKRLTYSEFSDLMEPIYVKAKGNNQNFYSFSHFLELLYILGVFGTLKDEGNRLVVIQSYHRGNRSFQRDGYVLFHPTVLKAFG